MEPIAQVSFEALIKELKVYTTVDLDKEARITLKFMPEDEVIDRLNRMMRGDRTLSVGIVARIDETIENNSNAIQKRTKRKPKGTRQGGEV